MTTPTTELVIAAQRDVEELDELTILARRRRDDLVARALDEGATLVGLGELIGLSHVSVLKAARRSRS